MDLDKAEKVKSLLEKKYCLLRERDEILNCSAIRGEIIDGVNGRPFRITRDSNYITYILRGLSEDIASINLEISEL